MTKIEDKLLKDFLYLEKKGIKFCMLQDYLSQREYHDVDVLVSSKQKRLLKRTLFSLGYKTHQMYSSSVFFHKLIDGELVRLHFHFNWFFFFLPFNEVYAKARRTKIGIKVLCDTDYYSTLIYKIRDGRPKEKYLKKVKGLKTIDKLILEGSLSKAFKLSSIKTNALLKTNKIKILEYKFLYILRRIWINLKDIPFVLIIALKKLLFPSPFVVFMGTDGSGKTTSVVNVANYLKLRKFRIHTFYGGRFKFQFLPINRFVRGVAKKEIEKGQNENVIHYSSKKIHYITPILYYVEYVLRYVFKIMLRRRTHNFVVADRSYIDVIISPNSNSSFAKFLYKILPKPSHIIYIYNDVNTIIKRRADHPKDDLLRQLKEFKKVDYLFDAKIKTINEKETLQRILRVLFG